MLYLDTWPKKDETVAICRTMQMMTAKAVILLDEMAAALSSVTPPDEHASKEYTSAEETELVLQC